MDSNTLTCTTSLKLFCAVTLSVHFVFNMFMDRDKRYNICIALCIVKTNLSLLCMHCKSFV